MLKYFPFLVEIFPFLRILKAAIIAVLVFPFDWVWIPLLQFGIFYWNISKEEFDRTCRRRSPFVTIADVDDFEKKYNFFWEIMKNIIWQWFISKISENRKQSVFSMIFERNMFIIRWQILFWNISGQVNCVELEKLPN